ncbi:hypothetical protein ASE95_13950 [Sphingomonas sp. Leaf231]|uniref:hypothetical protein n=1 Tax=Sphingomonas sp. Leaf231 TaxID=1736301 RepID=UPI0006FD7634|nr:hypothetical protein [Sphingomonas sp. Leaf231]KQN90561.1 hypothetical protein ASE95_13950 [Sphingomonas sp. Leaf231]
MSRRTRALLALAALVASTATLGFAIVTAPVLMRWLNAHPGIAPVMQLASLAVVALSAYITHRRRSRQPKA